jgi:TPR repeat protein
MKTMPCANRLPTISTIASLLFALGASNALAQTALDDKASKERLAGEIAEAVTACDKGASVPLDFSAKAAPVQFTELYPEDFDMTKARVLQAQCQAAWVGAPKERRMELQWIRVTMMINADSIHLLAPQLRKLAGQGSAEAQYLIYRLYILTNSKPASVPLNMISQQEARTELLKAAEQGHIEALRELMVLYRGSGMFRRDLKMSVLYARRAEGAPPQGPASSPYEDFVRADAPHVIATTTLEEEGFPATEQRAAFRYLQADMDSGGKTASSSIIAVAEAMRIGRGTRKDLARARELLEQHAERYAGVRPLLAEMLVSGEGGSEDTKRALELLRDPGLKFHPRALKVKADILLSDKPGGRRPQEAIATLAAAWDVPNYIRLAGLLVDYHRRLDNADMITGALAKAAAEGSTRAALALAKLKLSDNSQFADEDGARTLLKPLADVEDREARWLYASTQYRNLGSTSYRPMRREEGLSDAELMAIIDKGIRQEEPEAFLLKAKFLRAGILYPQDDRAASDMLKQAARGDNIEALLLLGDAYDDGLGITKDKKRRLDAWRRAAELGSIKAKSKIARAFTFDTFDRLMTLEEGVTWRIALYNNGYGRSFEGMGLGAADLGAQMDLDVFSGRAMEAGTEAVAEAIMNGFREAPAGLEDNNLVTMGKAFPQEIKVAIERRLARDGFYRGSPEGYWGPEARKALADWVEAKGYDTTSTDTSAVEEEPAAVEAGELISKDSIGRKWDRIRSEFQAAKNDRQKRAALAKVNLLAQYGNIDARWALLPNYHQAAMVRRVVSAAEITRYGLDLMLTKPPGAEKIEFEFIFNTTQIYQDGKAREFGQSVIAAIRDDKRLQDPLALGGVLKQFIFAPGACDAVLASAKRAGVDGLGEDGCDEATLSALVAFAKTKGPAGIDERNKKAAAEALKDI